jgi:hypothetical protein
MTAGGAFVGGSPDGGGWAYFNDPAVSAQWGTFIVNCTHNDLKGTSLWTSF